VSLLVRRPVVLGVLFLLSCTPGPTTVSRPPVAPQPPVELRASLVAPSEDATESTPFELLFGGPEGELSEPPRVVTLVFSRPVQSVEGSLESSAPVARVTTQNGIELAGRWIWYGTRTASFELSGAAPWASEIEVLVPGTTRALDGATLGADRAFTFATPRPALSGAYSSPFEPGYGYRVDLDYNQPIALGEVLRTTSIMGSQGGQRIPIPWANAEADVDTDYESTNHGLRLRRVPDGVTDVAVEIAAGLRGADGPRVSLEPARFPLPELGALKVTLECERAPDERCAFGSYPTLELSKSVPTLALFQRLRFEPKVPKERYDYIGSTSSVLLHELFDLEPGRRYRVEILPGWVTDDGERITRRQSFDFTMADAPPSLEWTRSLELVIPKDRPAPFLSFWGTNVPALQAAFAPLADDAVVSWLGGRGARHYDAVAGLARAKEIRLPLSLGPNQPQSADLPLPAGLIPANGTGSFLVATHAPGVAEQDVHLITVTDLGVSARWSAHGSFVWLRSLGQDRPVVGARVCLDPLDASGHSLPSAFCAPSDQDGIVALPDRAVARFVDRAGAPQPLITVSHQGDVARLRPERLRRDTIDPVSFVFVDRGIYQPGESLHVKAYFRTPGASGLETPVGRAVDVVVRDGADRVLWAHRAKTDDFGSVATEGTLPETAVLGFGSVEVNWDGALLERAARSFVISRYRVIDFEVKAELDRSEYVRGDQAVFDVFGRYFYGAAMRDVPVRMLVTSDTAAFSPPGYPGYAFGDPMAGEGAPEGDARRQLDADGRTQFTYPLALSDAHAPVSVQFTAEVTDVGNHFAVADDDSAFVHPAEFYVGLRPDGVSPRYPGRPITVDVIAVAPNGKLERDAEVTLELVPSRGADSTRTPRALGRCTVRTSDEPRRCTFVPGRPGRYTVRARSTDRRGNPVLTALEAEVLRPEIARWHPPRNVDPTPSAPSEAPTRKAESPPFDFAAWCQEQDRETGLSIVREDEAESRQPGHDSVDVRRFTPGEVARVCIVSPAAARALVTLERDGVLEREMVSLSAGGNLRPVPISDRLFPTSVLRVETASLLHAVVETELLLDSSHKSLDVGIRLPQNARPGQTARVDVRVLRSGKPAAAQVTLWAVDAGVLALRPLGVPDPFGRFAERGPSWPWSYSTDIYTPLVQSHRTRAPNVRMGATLVSPPNGSPIREHFAPVAWYVPDLRLDTRGKASVEVTLPHNATRWHVFAVAATRDDAFGGAEATFEASQPLLLRPRLPRASRVGDRFRAAVVIDSTLSRTLDVEVAIASTGVLEGRLSSHVHLTPRGHATVELPLEARRAGVATLTFTARSGELQDAVRIEHRVSAPVPVETAVVEGVAQPVAWERLGRLEGARPDVGGLTVTLSNSALGGLGEVVRALETYPYGCTEQLVSSLVPSLVLVGGGRELGVASSLGRAEIEHAVSSLLSHQRPDGGFGFWTGSASSDPWLSGYALLGLLKARAAGLPVSGGPIARATRYLESLPPDADGDSTERTWLEDVLAMADAPRRGRIAALAAAPGALSASDKVVLAHAAALAGDRALGRKLLDPTVTNSIVLTGVSGYASLPGPGPSELLRSRTGDTALVVRALAVAWPDHPALGRLVRGLLSSRRNGRYSTTHEAAWALLALDEVRRTGSTSTGPIPPDLSAHVWLDESLVAESSLRGRTIRVARAELPLARLLSAPGGRLGFQGDGGPLFYQAILRTTPRSLPTEPMSHGLSVERALARATYDGDRQRAASSFTVGDWVELSAIVTTVVPREQVAIVLPLPAGLEAVDPLHATTARLALPPVIGERHVSEVQRHDDRIELFVDSLPAGASRFSELARATMAGDFVLPPATAQCLYSADVQARTATARVTVGGDG
jgi:alpha-2-macroglobulin